MSISTEQQGKLDGLASAIRVKLREAGSRVVSIGFDLVEARRILGPGKPFELWCLEKLSISQATAYRWIATAQRFLKWGLDRRPDLLDESDFGELLSVTFPVHLEARINARVKALDKAEEDAAEVNKIVSLEAKRLEKAVKELAEAEVAEGEAADKADKVRKAAEAKVADIKAEPSKAAEAVRSKVSDLRERLRAAREKAEAIKADARAKVQQAQATVKQVSKAVAASQARKAEAEAAEAEAKAAVQTEVKAVKGEAKGKGKDKPPEPTKAPVGTWAMFMAQWVNTLMEKAAECFPDDRAKQAANIQQVSIILANKAEALARPKAA